LRRPEMARNLKLRSKVAIATRSFMDEQGFLEVETPTLFKSTPEGAREFLVPSRTSVGQFYALPQSPQQFKQILMVAGRRKIFSTRAVLSRRGFARRPPAGVHAGGHRNVVHRTRGHLQSHRRLVETNLENRAEHRRADTVQAHHV